MMMCMFIFSFFNGFQKGRKLPKYIGENFQTSTSIYKFSKTTKLPMDDDVYV